MILKFESEEFYELSHRMEFFRRAACALKFNGIAGDYAEFGCYGARTFRLAYVSLRRYGHKAKLWAFDSFAGLPPLTAPEDHHPRWVPGSYNYALAEFREACEQQKIPPAEYQIVQGYYDKTLTDPAAALPKDIALAYVDCDMYSSTKTVLEFLVPRLRHGMIIGLDDYYCWSADQPAGNRLAMVELAERCHGFNFVPFVQIGWHGMSFMVESREKMSRVAPRSLLSH